MNISEKIFLVMCLSTCALLVLIVLPFGVYAGFRWYCLRKVYGDPVRRARASMVVKPLDLSTVSMENTTNYSLGYASCRLPADIPFSFYRPSASPAIVGTSEFGKIVLLIPQTHTMYTQELHELEQEIKHAPDTSPLKQKISLIWQDPIVKELLMENTVPLPFKTVLGMSHENFSLYCLNLQMKSNHLLGDKGLYTYKTHYSYGLIKAGSKEKGKNVIWAICASSSTSIFQGIYFHFPQENNDIFTSLMKQFIANYQFNGIVISNQEHIIDMISMAGIQRKKPEEIHEERIKENK
jgi:hypothetical protein